MPLYDRIALGRKSKELGFVRDTFEKVCRLADVITFIESDSLISEKLSLKGGTAVNLTIFSLPRLSVDIDLDYSRNVSREQMLEDRAVITEHIRKYMASAGYILSPRSKRYHALDSLVYEYENTGGVKDNIKIEINYMLRCHILPLSRRMVNLPWNEERITVLCADPLEIFSSKTVALLSRAAPRDLYDIYNMNKYKLLDEGNRELFRKCVVFYSAIASEHVPSSFSFVSIDSITERQIRAGLTPVLRSSEHFDLAEVRGYVKEYLAGILTLDEKDLSFWRAFDNGSYQPELLFTDGEILSRIGSHPMAVWKCGKKRTS